VDSPEGEILKEEDYTGKTIFLDLEFLFNVFLREGATINMRVIKGVPEGAKATHATIHDGSLVVIFDTLVPEEIWLEDYNLTKRHKADLN